MNSRTTEQLLESALLVRNSTDLCSASAKSIWTGHTAVELSQERLQRSLECLARSSTDAPGAHPESPGRKPAEIPKPYYRTSAACIIPGERISVSSSEA